jgi:carbonic anhydrase
VMAKLLPDYTAEAALARLQEGKQRFVSGRARFPTIQKKVLAERDTGRVRFLT